MKGLPEDSAMRLERKSSDIFSLAVTVGFIVFLLTGELKGGFTAVQGFFAGFFATFSLYVLACLMESYLARSAERHKIYLSVPANASIKQAESESGETIRIYVDKTPTLKQEVTNIPKVVNESKYNFETCVECYRLCLAMVIHCQAKGGPQAGIKQMRLLLDCAEICQTAADFLPRGSDLHLTICSACAVVCLKCAAACEEFTDDDLMQACAAACRRCAEFCQALVASATEEKVMFSLSAAVVGKFSSQQ